MYPPVLGLNVSRGKGLPDGTRRVRNLLARSAIEQRLVLQAACVVSGIRLGLWFLPTRSVLRRVARVAYAANGKQQADLRQIRVIVWAVEAVSAFIPRASCLTQALATQLLLAKYGHASQLEIGVGRDEQGRLQAHAWVESAGRVVIGGGQLDRFQPFPQVQQAILSQLGK